MKLYEMVRRFLGSKVKLVSVRDYTIPSTYLVAINQIGFCVFCKEDLLRLKRPVIKILTIKKPGHKHQDVQACWDTAACEDRAMPLYLLESLE